MFWLTGLSNDSQSFDDEQAQLSTTSSAVPYFSSTNTPHLSDRILRSHRSIPESVPLSNSLEKNTRELIDQVKTLIHTLGLLLKHKTDVKSFVDQKRFSKKTKQPSSKSDRSKNHLFPENITITRRNFPLDHSQKSTIVITQKEIVYSITFQTASVKAQS